tara:strand:- start:976 stop:1182 length:207 start_codon:yes stop_codon:yes gene_type:complete
MTRLVEIITNTLILKKQVLEVELEQVINGVDGKVDDMVNSGMETLKSISEINNIQKTLESYINNNNKK